MKLGDITWKTDWDMSAVYADIDKAIAAANELLAKYAELEKRVGAAVAIDKVMGK